MNPAFDERIRYETGSQRKRRCGQDNLFFSIGTDVERSGEKVLAIDADPDANLAAALGIKNAEQVTPIADMKELIFDFGRQVIEITSHDQV